MERAVPPAPDREEAVRERGVVTAPPTSYRWVAVIWYVISVVNVLCGVRFVLRLLGASTASQFVTFVYGVSAPLVAPFRGIFPEPGTGPFVWDPAALVAIGVYTLIGAGIVALIRILANPRRRRTAIE
jgi:YggT family protein